MKFGVTVMPDPPHARLVELMQQAERQGFEYGWTYDSHILWHEPYPLLTLAAMETTRLKLGLNVTNPGTREPTVTASAFATLHEITGGRMIIGIGRGDSARRVIGLKPVKVAEFERRCVMIKDFMNGRSASPGASATASSSSWPTRSSSSGSWSRRAPPPPRPAATQTRSSASSARRRR